ncbi:spore gernimation protein [Paenibacillus sp. IHB B 3415]|uniref:GerAB/ArcD/ProY family transporter n=1 Tax=Paenibacillus sp. IHB B 3415 TaxID=867080 RepID=UPI0005752D3D|nr:GerAB/ArcD/ProY family transporter [Paenibacillus sp. IHB B 3415]KHL95708.1 spore gernimation protein [Paenibacillus sp. IHB B 3415]
MNKDARVSEIAVTLALFELGSTPLFLLGADSKQDAWLAMIIAAAAGFILLQAYLWMYRLDPERDLFEICLHYLGKTPGWIVAFSFVGYFTYESSRNLRDLGELCTMTLLNQTPMPIISLLAISVVAFVSSYGPKVFFRLCVIFLYILTVGYFLILIFIPMSGLFHLEYMFPILENGVKPVWDAAIPELISFPFGQTVLFLVFFKYAPKGNKNLSKFIVTSYIIIAIALIILNQMVILVMNPEVAGLTTYPLLTVVQMIRAVQIFERADALFTLILFIGLGVKMNIFFIGSAIGMQRLTKIRYKIWLIPLTIAIFALSFSSRTYTDFIWVGLHYAVIRVFPIFQIALPAVILITMLIRKRN